MAQDGFNIHGILINVENIDQTILNITSFLIDIKKIINEEIGRGTDPSVVYGWMQDLVDAISTGDLEMFTKKLADEVLDKILGNAKKS